MWTGEFGRLPISQGTDGRDHNRHAFSLWLAGCGFKFCGPTIVYAFMQAVGMVNDHLVTCHRHAVLAATPRPTLPSAR